MNKTGAGFCLSWDFGHCNKGKNGPWNGSWGRGGCPWAGAVRALPAAAVPAACRGQGPHHRCVVPLGWRHCRLASRELAAWAGSRDGNVDREVPMEFLLPIAQNAPGRRPSPALHAAQYPNAVWLGKGARGDGSSTRQGMEPRVLSFNQVH